MTENSERRESYFCIFSSVACRVRLPFLPCDEMKVRFTNSSYQRHVCGGRLLCALIGAVRLNLMEHLLRPDQRLTLTAAPSCLLGVERTGSSEAPLSPSAEPLSRRPDGSPPPPAGRQKNKHSGREDFHRDQRRRG